MVRFTAPIVLWWPCGRWVNLSLRFGSDVEKDGVTCAPRRWDRLCYSECGIVQNGLNQRGRVALVLLWLGVGAGICVVWTSSCARGFCMGLSRCGARGRAVKMGLERDQGVYQWKWSQTLYYGRFYTILFLLKEFELTWKLKESIE